MLNIKSLFLCFEQDKLKVGLIFLTILSNSHSSIAALHHTLIRKQRVDDVSL